MQPKCECGADQMPGRTITESEYRYAMIEATDTEDFDAEELLRRLGITVTPDPEPTNAELINEAYDAWDRGPQDFTFGEYLDRLGWAKSHD